MLELEIAQQRQQNILGQNVPVMAGKVAHMEEKGYNSSVMDADHKKMLGIKNC